MGYVCEMGAKPRIPLRVCHHQYAFAPSVSRPLEPHIAAYRTGSRAKRDCVYYAVGFGAHHAKV